MVAFVLESSLTWPLLTRLIDLNSSHLIGANWTLIDPNSHGLIVPIPGTFLMFSPMAVVVIDIHHVNIHTTDLSLGPTSIRLSLYSALQLIVAIQLGRRNDLTCFEDFNSWDVAVRTIKRFFAWVSIIRYSSSEATYSRSIPANLTSVLDLAMYWIFSRPKPHLERTETLRSISSLLSTLHAIFVMYGTLIDAPAYRFYSTHLHNIAGCEPSTTERTSVTSNVYVKAG